MEIVDDEFENRLKLYENSQGKIYLEVGANDSEDAPYYTGAITLNADDARSLIGELQRLLKGMEGHEKKNEPQQRAASPVAKQLTLSPEQPIQKVNWNK